MDKLNGYFNSAASEYDAKYKEVNDVASFIFSERRRIVFEIFNLKEGRVLDAACGPAVYTKRLSELGLDVYGVDSSEKMVEIARGKRFKNASFSVGRADRLNFEDSFFDGVLCVGLLEYLDDIEGTVRELARVTRKGGTAIFTAPIRESLLNRLDLLLRSLLRAAWFVNRGYGSKLISEKDLAGVLEKYGFLIEEKRFHIFRLTFLNKPFPRLALAVTKKMNFVSGPLLSANCIIRCRRG